VGETGTRLAVSPPKKTLYLLTNPNGVSEASAHTATELLKILLYKVTVIKELFPSYWEAKNW
jgi:hypothetical protein